MSAGTDQDLREPTTTDDRAHRRRRLATALAVLCVLVLAGAVALILWLRHETEQREAVEENRVEALQAAVQFTEVYNTFRPSTASEYVDEVSSLLTSRFRAEFEGASQDVIAGITQQRLFSKGEVLETEGVPIAGVSSMDQDSAEVLVVADARRVAGGQRLVRHWRWQVSLDKVDGTWLVDDFKEV